MWANGTTEVAETLLVAERRKSQFKIVDVIFVDTSLIA